MTLPKVFGKIPALPANAAVKQNTQGSHLMRRQVVQDVHFAGWSSSQM